MVLHVFGQNLRLLTTQRGSIASVSAELHISRVQFQRFLKGEAFPKPQVLNRICLYFGVDARILLTPLQEIMAAQPANASAVPNDLHPDLAHLMAWATRGQGYALTQDYLEDGLYRYWVADGVKPDTYHCMHVQFGSRAGRAGPFLQGARSWRGYFHRGHFGGAAVSRREVRGMALRVPDGIICLLFNPTPILRITMMHIAPNPVVADGSFVGFTAWGRAEITSYGRVARCYVQRVLPTAQNILACARMQPTVSGADLPPVLKDYLAQPVENLRAYSQS